MINTTSLLSWEHSCSFCQNRWRNSLFPSHSKLQYRLGPPFQHFQWRNSTLISTKLQASGNAKVSRTSPSFFSTTVLDYEFHFPPMSTSNDTWHPLFNTEKELQWRNIPSTSTSTKRSYASHLQLSVQKFPLQNSNSTPSNRYAKERSFLAFKSWTSDCKPYFGHGNDVEE